MPIMPALGSGQRFAQLTAAIAARGNVRNPAAVAAAIGRRKYGAKKFAQLSAAGRKRHAGHRAAAALRYVATARRG